jgi:hypothetical protein
MSGIIKESFFNYRRFHATETRSPVDRKPTWGRMRLAAPGFGIPAPRTRAKCSICQPESGDGSDGDAIAQGGQRAGWTAWKGS